KQCASERGRAASPTRCPSPLSSCRLRSPSAHSSDKTAVTAVVLHIVALHAHAVHRSSRLIPPPLRTASPRPATFFSPEWRVEPASGVRSSLLLVVLSSSWQTSTLCEERANPMLQILRRDARL
ncbi:hypothetical protein RTBOTA2_000310, partial [Rhodotorula toruloides]